MFDKKTWKDRVSQFPARRTLTDVETGVSRLYTVSRAEGSITEEGDPFSADIMSGTDPSAKGLEVRIKDECDALERAFATVQTTNTASTAFQAGSYLVLSTKGGLGFYKVTRAINTGDSLVVGSNISATTVGTELRVLAGNLAGTNTNLNSLAASTNNAINAVGIRIDGVDSQLLKRPIGRRLGWSNIRMTNGTITSDPIDCGAWFPTRAYALTVTAGQTGALLYGYLRQAQRTAVIFEVKNATDPSYTGNIPELNVIIWGD